MLVRVLTASRSSGISDGLTYASDTPAVPGQYVRVPLRRQIVDGIVLEIAKHKDTHLQNIKEIHGMTGNLPLLSAAQIRTLLWMSEYYHCSPRQALQVWLPAPPWKHLLPVSVTTYALADDDPHVRGSRQQMLVEALRGGKMLTQEQLREETGVGRATIRALEERGVITASVHAHVHPQSNRLPSCTLPTLTPGQHVAYESLKNDHRPSLLFGVTSSGKTEIYAALIADAVAAGKQSILLVPEILLTEHCIARFERLFGGREHIAVLHSKLTPAQRRNAWRAIHAGAVRLVIGSRSALFAPAHNLGLVILDEEHEWTYKNEQTPRYHARETAEMLCRHAGAKLVLGSATPSLETFARAQDAVYHIARLPDRYGDHAFPAVRVIDLASVSFGSLYPLSPPLIDAIEERLMRGEQSILFFNRRGTATALLCLDCRRRIISPASQLPYTVHTRRDGTPFLMDHTTGATADMPSACPHCQSVRLFAAGAGTQRLDTLLQRQFPQARILRADSDTLRNPEQMRDLLTAMRNRDADILLGTQSVVKGLDLPGVTLAAVVLADIGLSLPHFRAGERVFQLLTQLTGRSGRAQPGEVIIQTFRPDAPEVRMAAEHRTEEYLEQELKLRRHAGYPPIMPIIRLLTRGAHAAERAGALTVQLRAQGASCTVSCSPTLFGGGREWQVLIRGTDPAACIGSIDLDGIVVDIDPIECI